MLFENLLRRKSQSARTDIVDGLGICEGRFGNITEQRTAGFESLKDEITEVMGIQSPTYCVSAKWFRNVSEHIERA